MPHNTPLPRDRVLHPATLAFARDGDVLVIARPDRLARSLRQLLSIVDALQARGIGLRSLHERIDTTSATGRLILHIFTALGQFEVELLRERTRTALAASRARGRIGGRPPALNAVKIKAAKAMLASGTMTASEVARQVGCPSSTLYRRLPGGHRSIRPLPDQPECQHSALCGALLSIRLVARWLIEPLAR
jgi:DNA invertase Pin-like site-specific DNA recombinase